MLALETRYFAKNRQKELKYKGQFESNQRKVYWQK